MKRIAVLVLAAFLVFSADLFALKSTPDFGIGAELTTINFGTAGAMLTVHFPSVPLYFGFGGNFVGGVSGRPELTATVDYWLLHNPIGGGFFSWYLGIGGYGVLAFNPGWFALGARLPVGLQMWPLDNERLEIFLELAPAWVPVTSSGFEPARFQAQVALGFRFWLERGE